MGEQGRAEKPQTVAQMVGKRVQFSVELRVNQGWII
jgi:hypothetical protein